MYNFAEMLVGVKEFLELQNLRPASFLVRMSHQKALHPITVTLDSTFHSLVTEMAAMRVHRGDLKFFAIYLNSVTPKLNTFKISVGC